MMSNLARALLRQHRWAYVGLFASIVAAAALVTAAVGLFAAAQSSDGINFTGMSTNKVAMMGVDLETAQYFTAMTAGISLFIAVFLVSSGVSFVVEGRRRELALLRLAGASPRQITMLVLEETALVGASASVVGAVIGAVLIRPYATVLSNIELMPAELDPRVRPGIVAVCVVAVTLFSVVGATLPARRIGKIEPIEALQPAITTNKPISRGRMIWGILGAIGSVALLLVPVTVGEFQSMTVLLGGTSILALTALSPVLVPFVARGVGSLVMRLAPGAGLVAREHCAFAIQRTAALANPIILLVGLGGTVFMLAQTGQAAGFITWQDALHAEVVVLDEKAQVSEDALSTATAEIQGVQAIVPYHTSNKWAWTDDEPAYPTIAWTDPQTLPEVVNVALKGNLVDVKGDHIATTSREKKIGDTFTLEAPDGELATFTVVAVIEPTALLSHDVIADVTTSDLHETVPYQRWFVTGTAPTPPDELAATLSTVLPDADVMTMRGWIDQNIENGRANQTQGLGAMVAGAMILALIALTQSILTSLRERQDELRLLTTVGARERSVIGSATVEVCIVVVTAALLVAGVMATIYLRMGQYLSHENLDLAPVLPVDVLLTLLAVAGVAAIGCAIIGSAWALRQTSRNR